MRKSTLLAASALAALPLAGAASAAGLAGGATTTPAAACAKANAAAFHTKGKLTIATDNPAYTPWFVNNKPANGKGYESAVAYAVANQLGFTAKQVTWAYEPFDNSYQPGAKPFDFDINEISVTPDRAAVVSFSNSYYDVTQSIVTLKTDAIVKHHSPADLKKYVYGDQLGTTGYQYILNHLKPTQSVHVYNTLDDAVNALLAKQIDAIVVDTPDGQYMASGQIPSNKGTQIGQFPSTGEHYGLLFSKGSALVGCVNSALSTLSANGTLTKLQKQYLGIYNKVPTIQP